MLNPNDLLTRHLRKLSRKIYLLPKRVPYGDNGTFARPTGHDMW